MLADRVKVVLILLPLGLVVFYIGGLLYLAVMALVLGLASFEYARLFRTGGYAPSSILVVISTVALAASRALINSEYVDIVLTVVVFGTMAFHLVQYERGRDQAGTNFAITLSGAMYFGWLGAYLILLRQLPDGFWWLLLTLGCVWIGDSGAYSIGRRFGKHALSPRLSPKKTWEGYGAEIVTAVIGGPLLVLIFQALPWFSGDMQLWHGAVMGLAVAVITPLGDLGESMIKRQAGAKDSGNLLPGHGGAWDRIDSWLWAAAIGYYLITLLFTRL